MKEWAEEYDSLEEVDKELQMSAVDEYRDQVMAKLRAGVMYFEVANGPDIDVWEVIPY
jgi:hypothetical protein